jgi:biopolymer transport protein ExbB
MLEVLNPAHALDIIGNYLRAGGPVVVALLVSTFLMWLLIIERLLYFGFAQPGLAAAQQQAWQARADHSTWYAHAIRERLISEIRVENERHLGVIKVLILVTPLLGLLGTVTGMVEVFQVITATGTANARLMAAGISKATIPTMTGLAVSLTGVFAISFLQRRNAHSVSTLADSLDVQVTPAEAAR